MNFTAFLWAFVPLCLLIIGYLIWLEWPKITEQLFASLYSRVALERQPDFVIGTGEDPYLWRWWILPRNRFCKRRTSSADSFPISFSTISGSIRSTLPCNACRICFSRSSSP